MRTRSRNPFTTVTTSGLLLPVDLLTRVVEGDPDLPGLSPKDYHLRSGERLNEAASRAWNECLACWKSFRKKLKALPASDAGTTLTRDEWLLPLFQELGYGRLQGKKAIEIEGKEYPISHGWENHVPIHLLSAKLPLDRRTPGAAGAATRAPYSLLQEQLNRSSQHRWGFVSNGLKLFLLRDNAALARAANVEFDLEAMMDGEVYSDFMLLFLLCHQSRVEILGSGSSEDADQRANPEDCWLEKWANQADQQGTRARERLRDGVEAAIKALGAGFLTTKGNNQLRDRLRTGELSTQDFYRELLRVVYRLLMLLVAEEKRSENGQNLFHPPGTPPEVRDRYARFYSVGRIRSLAYERRGTAHTDLYESLKVLFLKLREGYAPLGIPGMGSFLFSDDSTPDLDQALLANQDLLDAFRQLCYTEDTSGRGGGVRRPVDFGNLGSEELGSVYESLLELHPQIDTDEGPFTLGTAAGHERKTTGSYYTPRSLINCLLDSALDPVVNEAIDVPDAAEAEQKLLDLKVCDPACGSGHFLIAAAERMATHLARLRTGDDQPNTLDVQHAKRDIIGRCIYGVDVNPMAVELCKVSLWMEALEPGKPLSFLDHHIQCGNSLLGATPRLLAEGIPDDAFKPIEGDDKEVCKDLKKSNKKEREEYKSGQGYLFEPPFKLGNAAAEFAKLTAADDNSLDSIAAKRKRYEELVKGSNYLNARFWADTWCASFVWKKDESDLGRLCPTERKFRDIERNPHNALPHVRAEVSRLSAENRFFHWHIAFPDVFQLRETNTTENAGWTGGFDVLLGNPPWERMNLEAKQFFAGVRPGIASATTNKRKKLIAELQHDDPALFRAFQNAQRMSAGEIALCSRSGRFPHLRQARLNTYVLFVEVNVSLCSDTGRAGLIVPTGIATDDTSRELFRFLIENRRLVSLFDFENRDGVFPDVHRSHKICALTVAGENGTDSPPDFVFYAPNIQAFSEEHRHFSLAHEDLMTLSPITGLCPTFRNRTDQRIVLAVHRHVAPFIIKKETGHDWVDSDFLIMFRSASSSHLYRSKNEIGDVPSIDQRQHVEFDGEQYIPVWEAKLLHQFDHRYSSFDGISDTDIDSGKARKVDEREKETVCEARPRFWAPSSEVASILSNRQWERHWTIGYRDVTNATNERTAIASVLPEGGAAQPLNLFLPETAFHGAVWLAAMNSFPLDYVVRQCIGWVHLNITTCRQLPMLSIDEIPADLRRLIGACVCELTYTSTSLSEFANELGYDGPHFHWDLERRILIRSELDAAFFHLYGISRSDASYIMDTFPVVRRKDEAKYDGDYRTKTNILKIYDAMAEAIRIGQPYQTHLNPPPGPPTDNAGNFIPFSEWTDAIREQYASVIHIPAHDGDDVVDEGILSEVSYPGVAAFDRSVCAAALRVVDQEPGIESPEHLDLLLLSSHPEFCEPFLDESDAAQLSQLKQSDSFPFRAETGTSIRWKECRDYLELRLALTVDRDTTRQPIRKGPSFAAVLNEFDAEVEELLNLAFKAMEVIRSLRGDLTLASVVQRRVIEKLDKFREQYDLAA